MLVHDAGHGVAVALGPGGEEAREARRCGSSSSPTSPRSSSASLSSGVMKMFPGCRSACTKPSSKIILSSACRPRRATRFGIRARAGVARILVPSMKLMVRMRSVDSASITSGKTTSGSSAEVLAEAAVVARPRCGNRAARRSRARTPRRSATGASVAIDGMAFSRRAPMRITARSKVHSSTTLGRRTLTATMRPSAAAPCGPATPTPRPAAPARTRRRARRSGGRGRSSMVRTTASNGNGPTSSCSSLERARDVLGDEVGPRAHDLADLDEGGAQLAEQIERPPARTRPAPRSCRTRRSPAAQSSRSTSAPSAWPRERQIAMARRHQAPPWQRLRGHARNFILLGHERPPRPLRSPAGRSAIRGDIAELRKDEPRTAVAMWKRRVARHAGRARPSGTTTGWGVEPP